MFRFFKNHPKVIWGILIAAAVISLLAVYQRVQYNKHPYIDQLGNPERAAAALTDTFYEDQLTEKEMAALSVLKDAAASLTGGVIEFPETLTGKEYSRVSMAFTCGQEDFFYALAEVPMTKDDQSVSYIQKNILNITDESITKCILFLYPAKGLDTRGEIDENGYVTNLSALELSEMVEEKKARLEELSAAADEALDKVLSELPGEYGTREAIDYFLSWMQEALKPAESHAAAGMMSEAFENIYFASNRSSAGLGQATAAGYAKILSYLCNRAGIPAHIVLGNWKNTGSYPLTAVDFGGTWVFVDASGAKASDTWKQQYLSQTFAARYFDSIDYFDSVSK